MGTKGKRICNILKDVRKQIADANGIEYTPGECHHQGECSGTCPMCEQEKSFLEQQIGLKQKAGKAIKIVGIASSLVTLSAQPLSAQTSEPLPEDVVMNWDLHFFDFNGGPFPVHESITNDVAEYVADNPDELYIVIGKTDNRGSEYYNLKLSQKRADYICQMVKARNEGKPLKLVPVGVGANEPSIQHAQDEAEHEQNRKATVETYAPQRHRGKVAVLIEYAICKEFGVTIPPKLKQQYAALYKKPYNENTMQEQYNRLAEKLRMLREKH